MPCGRVNLRLVLGIVLALALVAGGALYVMVESLDTLVRRAIESYGSDAAGTAVRVAEVKIRLNERRGTLRGLTVANPPGYSPAPLFALDDITLAIDAAALSASVPVIDELRIGATAFRYELDPQGRSNLSVVQQHLRQQGKGSGRPADGDSRRLRIRRLVIADGEATLDLGMLGIGRVTAKVPGVILTDLGGKQGGTADELARAIVAALTANLEKSLANAGIGKLLRHSKGSPLNQALQGLLGR